jgi:hypothetical protein
VGGYLAGLRTPAKAYVLTYAGADWVGADPTAADGFAADPAAAVGAAPPGAYLFIAGLDDLLFSRASVTRYARASPGDVRLEWQPGGHGDLGGADARTRACTAPVSAASDSSPRRTTFAVKRAALCCRTKVVVLWRHRR